MKPTIDSETARDDAIRKLAIDTLGEDGAIEFDDNSLVSEGEDNGAYVRAWVWVSFAGTKLDKD